MRTAEADRHAEALHRADADVGAHRPGRGEQDERERVGRDHGERVARVELLDRLPPVADATIGTRMLEQCADDLAVGQPRLEVGDDDLDAERLGSRLDDGDRLRQRVLVDQKDPRVLLGVTEAQRHRLGRGRGLVEQRRIGARQAREVGDDGLVVEQRLEAPLRDLRLIRRVGRVPGRVLEHLAEHDLRRVRAVVAEADHLRHDAIALADLAQLVEHLDLGGGRRHVDRLAHADRLRHGRGLQRVEGVVAELRQHRELVLLARPDVPGREWRGLLQLEKGRPLSGRRGIRVRSHLHGLSRTRPWRSHSP